MATISERIARQIMEGGFPEDRPVKIVTYNNQFNGGLEWAIRFAKQSEHLFRYERSPACHNVKTIWEKT